MITFGRRLIAVPLLSAFLLATPVTAGQQTDAERQAREQQAREPFVLDGPIAIWTVAIRPDKTTDFEAIIGRVREALVTSPSAERRQQVLLGPRRDLRKCRATPTQDDIGFDRTFATLHVAFFDVRSFHHYLSCISARSDQHVLHVADVMRIQV